MLPGWDNLQDLRTADATNQLGRFLNKTISELKPQDQMAEDSTTPLPPAPSPAPNVPAVQAPSQVQAAQSKQPARQVEPLRRNIVGGFSLGERFAAIIDDAKNSVIRAETDLLASVGNLKGAARYVTDVAKAVQSEADHLMSRVGQISNMPPDDQDK
jgi:hypothetical protein